MAVILVMARPGSGFWVLQGVFGTKVMGLAFRVRSFWHRVQVSWAFAVLSWASLLGFCA